jgi:hypothetical protein
MRRGNISRALLSLAALLMLAGGTGHSLAFRKAAAVVEGSNLSGQYATIFKGLWLSVGVMTILIGLAYLILAMWPRLGTKTALAVLGALPFASAISIYSTVGSFAPAHLLLASAAMVFTAALLSPESRCRSRSGGYAIEPSRSQWPSCLPTK